MHFKDLRNSMLKRPPFWFAVKGKARGATILAGRVLRSKMPKMTRFALETPGFARFCDALRR
jgi:hypothetical protein